MVGAVCERVCAKGGEKGRWEVMARQASNDGGGGGSQVRRLCKASRKDGGRGRTWWGGWNQMREVRWRGNNLETKQLTKMESYVHHVQYTPEQIQFIISERGECKQASKIDSFHD